MLLFWKGNLKLVLSFHLNSVISHDHSIPLFILGLKTLGIASVQSLTFGPAAQQSFSITLVDDVIVETDESVTISLSRSDPNVNLLTQNSQLIIMDNDGNLISSRVIYLIIKIFFIVATLSLMEPVYSVFEGGSIQVCVELSGILGIDVTLNPAAISLPTDTATGIVS